MKNVITSVSIMPVSEWIHDCYKVRFYLFDEIGQKIFDDIQSALQGDGTPILIAGKSAFLTHSDLYVDETRGWAAFESDRENGYINFFIVYDLEEEKWYVEAEFDKKKPGLEAFDYTDYSLLPDDFWVEPAFFIRNLFSNKIF